MVLGVESFHWFLIKLLDSVSPWCRDDVLISLYFRRVKFRYKDKTVAQGCFTNYIFIRVKECKKKKTIGQYCQKKFLTHLYQLTLNINQNFLFESLKNIKILIGFLSKENFRKFFSINLFLVEWVTS